MTGRMVPGSITGIMSGRYLVDRILVEPAPRGALAGGHVDGRPAGLGGALRGHVRADRGLVRDGPGPDRGRAVAQAPAVPAGPGEHLHAVLGGLIGFLGGFARLQTVQDMHECCRPEGQALLAAQAWPWQVWVKLAVGCLMLRSGCSWPWAGGPTRSWNSPCPGPPALPGPGPEMGRRALPLGLAWGFIPCGLVYMMLLQAPGRRVLAHGRGGHGLLRSGQPAPLLGLGLAATRLSQVLAVPAFCAWAGLLVGGMGGAISCGRRCGSFGSKADPEPSDLSYDWIPRGRL